MKAQLCSTRREWRGEPRLISHSWASAMPVPMWPKTSGGLDLSESVTIALEVGMVAGFHVDADNIFRVKLYGVPDAAITVLVGVGAL